MPAHVVVIHDDPTFREPLVTSLRARGHDVAAFGDIALAWDALAASERIKILVTRINFGPGKPHGLALARSARMRKASIRALFVARPEYQEDAKDLGLFLAYPVTVPEVAAAVERMLADPKLGSVI